MSDSLTSFASPDILGFHPLYLALTIGCAFIGRYLSDLADYL